jgi:Protein of unknown function (DUF2933)
MKHEQHHDEGIVERKMLSKSRIVLIGFLLVIGYFLFTEHRAHVIAFLPYLLLLACPLMHLFMHGGARGTRAW